MVQAYAQPFHLDSSVMVIGAAAQVVGEVYGMEKKIYVTTEKHNFEPIAWGMFTLLICNREILDTVWDTICFIILLS